MAVDEIPTIPTLPALSTPTVANSGLKSPEIFAVWLTTHAAGLPCCGGIGFSLALWMKVPSGADFSKRPL
jgi:hypothetical protein